MFVKYIQYWDVSSGRQAEFDRFLREDYIPQLNATGLMRLVGTWHVAAGEGPYFIIEGVADSLGVLNDLLGSDDFEKLDHLLRFMIGGYKSKTLVSAGPVGGSLPAPGQCRFNLHYDVRPEEKDQHDRFLIGAYVPTMARLGVSVIGAWTVGIGPGPNVVVEGSCPTARGILGAVGSAAYQELVARLRTMVVDFGSKILVPSGHV